MTEMLVFAAEGALVAACAIDAAVRYFERKREATRRLPFLRALPWAALLIAGAAHGMLVFDAAGRGWSSEVPKETETEFLRREVIIAWDKLLASKQAEICDLQTELNLLKVLLLNQPQVGPRLRASPKSSATPIPNARGVSAATVPAPECPLEKP
jgi:hypothetical protein